MQAQPHILVVDDDREIRTLLGRYLDGQGFRVSVAADRRECEQKLGAGQFDLLVLDVMLPDGSGLDICRGLRDRKPHIPVILLTALKEDVDRIIGLELGADDYLGKPFNPRELTARIRAVLRRAAPEEIAPPPRARAYRFASYRLEPDTRKVTDAQGVAVDPHRRRIRPAAGVPRPSRPAAVARPAARPDARPRARSARPFGRRADEPAAPQIRRRPTRGRCSRRCAMAATS